MSSCRFFVSYSREDALIVVPIIKLLRISGVSVFRDKESISPGEIWQDLIVEAVDSCEYILLFWCHHSSISISVKKEYNRGIALRKKIVPILLDNTPLPTRLSKYQWIDLCKILGHHESVEKKDIPGIFHREITENFSLIVPDAPILEKAAENLSKLITDLLS